MTPSVDDVFSAAMALPVESRAVLANLLRDSLNAARSASDQTDEMDIGELAERLAAHFHEAKKVALHRAEETQGKIAAVCRTGD
jgi:hypothetical protein